MKRRLQCKSYKYYHVSIFKKWVAVWQVDWLFASFRCFNILYDRSPESLWPLLVLRKLVLHFVDYKIPSTKLLELRYESNPIMCLYQNFRATSGHFCRINHLIFCQIVHKRWKVDQTCNYYCELLVGFHNTRLLTRF